MNENEHQVRIIQATKDFLDSRKRPGENVKRRTKSLPSSEKNKKKCQKLSRGIILMNGD